MYEFTGNFKASRWLYFFIFLHFILWTTIPLLIRHNLPMDSIEGTIWGHQLEWGYDKNPFLNGWLTALAIYLGGYSGWMIYLFSQIAVALSLWIVWQLARNIMPETYALVSVLLLEGIQYYNFHAIDFNDNTLELALWPLTIYFFYRSLVSSERKISWLLTGFFAGLGVMAKYYTLALLAAMILYLIFHSNHRKLLRTFPPYLSLIIFIIIILPHTLWLFSHDFVTINYVFARTNALPSWFNHLQFPWQFTIEQLQVFLPTFIIFLLLFIGRKPFIHSLKLNKDDKAFILYMGLGPFILTILLALFFGIKLRAGWGMPLLSLWGMILLSYFPPTLTLKKMHCFLAGIFTLLILLLFGYSLSLIYSKTPTSANFPGQEIAQIITKEWHQTYHTKLNYVAGSRWIGGNISFYSKDHPAVFMEWNKQHSPWIDTVHLKEKGAVFVWDVSRNETIPLDIQKQFPHLEKSTVLQFAWQRNNHQLPPIKIGVAFLPPKDVSH